MSDMDELTKFMIEEVNVAFRAESSIGGKTLNEQIEHTNHALRLAWPFVMKALGEEDGQKSL